MLPTRSHFALPGFALLRTALLLALSSVLLLAGCAERRPKFRLSDAAYARPIVPAPAPDASSPHAPDLAVDPTAVPPRLAEAHAVPARPHTVAPATAEPSRPNKPADPILAPELSPQELDAAKSETERSLGAADGTLARTQGRLLNAAQKDLVAQIGSFASSARDASKDGDWPRARSLARKAEVLAQELAGTL